MSTDERHAQGMAVRRTVLGDDHVDRAEAKKTDFDVDFQRFIVETAWGSVWTGSKLTKRERSMITVTLLAAGGHHDEFAMHVRAMRRTGATIEDLQEILMHVAIYAGVPAANTCFGIAKRVLAEGEGPQWREELTS